MKRIHPSILVRIQYGYKPGIAVFLGLCTTGGLFITLIPLPTDKIWSPLVIIAIFLISLFIAYLSGQQKIIPYSFIDELSTENKYEAVYCDLHGLREADEMTRPLFGRDFIPVQQIEQWWTVNNKGFVQINNQQGILCACFVILGLEDSFFDQFIAGRVTEHEIDSKVILPFDEMKRKDRVYISGVVVRDPHAYLGRKRACIMTWSILQYIRIIFGLRKTRTFYAVALTSESEKLLQTLGFTIRCSKEGRRDKSNLYEIKLNTQKWNELMRKVGDYSKMVTLKIN